MLSLGQKTTLRKAIRPFGVLYRTTRASYSKLSEEERSTKQDEITALEDTMMDVFVSLKPNMSEEEVGEWTKYIQAECAKEDRQFDMFRDDDFGDGFRPVQKPEGATAYDERPVYPQEAKPAHPEAVGCFGKQLQSNLSNQKELGLGD